MRSHEGRARHSVDSSEVAGPAHHCWARDSGTFRTWVGRFDPGPADYSARVAGKEENALSCSGASSPFSSRRSRRVEMASRRAAAVRLPRHSFTMAWANEVVTSRRDAGNWIGATLELRRFTARSN